MGWFVVNIVLPVFVPTAFMALAGRVPTLPPEVAARTKLLLLVQDGQLGWVALGFSASCFYETLDYLAHSGPASPAWIQAALGLSLITLVASGFLAALGALFPAGDAYPEQAVRRSWVRSNFLFWMTSVILFTAATVRCTVHYNLSV